LVGSPLTAYSKSLATDGFVKVSGLVDSEFVHNILNSIDLSIQYRTSPFFRDLSTDQSGSFLSDIWSSHFVCDFTDNFIPPLLPSLISSLMNCPSIVLLQDTWFKRSSSCTTPIPWHHDQSIEGPFYSTWISLTDIPASSSLHFVRGSHKSGLRYLPASFFDSISGTDELNAMESFYRSFHYSEKSNYTEHFCPVPSDIESNSEYDIVAVPSSIGDLIIFNGLTLHSLSSFCTNSCGFVLRWVSADSVVSPYSNDAQIASDLLNVSLQSGEPITDSFFRRYNF
jgi:hypothetical protein